jgi:hypothetical protein
LIAFDLTAAALLAGASAGIGRLIMRAEGFDRFEEALDQFRIRFDDRFLRR